MAGISEIAGGRTEGRRVRRRHTLSTAGFTLVELLIVIAIIGILVALTLSAVQQAREAARRVQCMSNLHQTGVAIAGFTSAHRTLPPGKGERGHGWRVYLLPQMEQTPLFDRFDLSVSLDAFPNRDLDRESPGSANCPSDPSSKDGEIKATSYAGNGGNGVQRYGYNGFFRYASGLDDSGPLYPAGVLDGLSQTAAVSEILVGDGSYGRLKTTWQPPERLLAPEELEQFAEYCRSGNFTVGDAWGRGREWTNGNLGTTLYNHILTPNQNSCTNGTRFQQGAYTAASYHPGGVNVLFGDAHASFVSSDVDLWIWRAIGSRNGHEPFSGFP